jgi:hypothetical protein
MGWQEDLGDLLGELGGSPVGQGAQLVGRGLTEAPGAAVKYGTGTILGGINEVLGALPGQHGFYPEQSRALHEGGPLAMWEAVRAEEYRRAHSGGALNLLAPINTGRGEVIPFQALTELGLDPTTYLGPSFLKIPGRVGERAALALRAGATAADIAERPLLATGLRGGARGAEGAQFLYNDVYDMALGRLGRTRLGQATKGAGKAVISKIPGVNELSPEFELRHSYAASANANAADRSKGDAILPMMGKVTSESGPPIVPSLHPAGSLPDQIYKRGVRGWFSHWIASREGPGRLGVIAGTNDFGKASAMPGMSQHDLEGMIDFSLQTMQGAIDEMTGQTFGNLRTMAVHGPAWQEAMLGRYGQEREAILPHVWQETRRRRPELNMPAAEFAALPNALPGRPSAAHLDAVNARIASGEITREEGLIELQQAPKGAPQALQAAAAHGTSLMSLSRRGGRTEDFLRGGAYAPQIDPLTGKVGLPQGFAEDVLGTPREGLLGHDIADTMGSPLPYGSNRAAWEAYLQERLGQMQPDELETLAQISLHQYYNEMVRSAHRYALSAEEVAQGVRYKFGKGYTKTGVRATGAGQRGSPESQRLIRGMTEFTSSEYGGRIASRDLWSRQLQESLGTDAPITRQTLNEILGEAKTGAVTGDDLKRALAAQGEIPIGPNPKGGLLPNMTDLMNWHFQGMNLPAGTALGADAKGHYLRAAKELANLVGLGNHREFRILSTMLGLFSGGTDVQDGTRKAFMGYAEYLWRHDETIRTHFQGLDGEAFTQLVDSGVDADRKLGQVEDLFNLGEQQRVPLPRGPKEGQYAAQFLVPHYQEQLAQMVRSLPPDVARQAKTDLDEALSYFAVDRHISRVDNGPTMVNALSHYITRSRHVIAARKGNLSPEEAHGAAWFLARAQQGFRILHPESDAAQAVRQFVTGLYDTGNASDQQIVDLLRRVGESTGKEGDDLLHEAYQLARQDIAYRIVGAALADPKIGPHLRRFGLPENPEDLSRDGLGFLARGAHGLLPSEWPNPLGSSIDLGQQIETLAANPPATPTIFNFSSGSWQPVQGGGLAVPIMDGGTFTAGQVQTARKRFEQLVSKDIVAQVFDPTTGDRSAQLGIGIVPDGDKFRLNLYALTSDPAIAEQGAARAGARHIVDTTTGVMTPTRVTARRQASLPTLLKEMFGDAPPTIDPTREQARKRGISLFEMDRRNPVSIFIRKIVNPLMDAYEALTKAEGPANIQRTMADLGIDQHPTGELESRGYDWQISAQDNAALLRKTNRGLTHKEIIAKGSREGGAAQKALQDAGVHWKPFASIEDRRKAVAGNAELTKLVNKWHRLGIDPLYAQHPDDIGLALLEREMRKDAGLKVGRSTVPQLLAAAWGEQVLASGKYLTGNVFGNWVMAALAGHPLSLSPSQYLAAYKLVRGGLDGTAREDALRSLKGGEILRSYGLDGLPHEVMRGGIREVSSNTARYSPSATGELAGRITRSERIGRIVGAPFVVINDMAAAADVVARSSILGDVMDRQMQDMLPVWEAAVRQAGADIPGFEFSIADSINVPAGGLHTGPLYRKLQEIGLQPGVAEHLVRDYTNIRSKALGEARKEMERVLFSFDKTKLDVFIGKFIPFHYWYSRAFRFYAEESVRHPYLFLNYMRANEGIEEAQNDPGLSARQKGFIGLFGTPLGFTLLMNPDALMGVVKVFTMDDSFEPDGQTSIGGVIQWAKDRGLGLYPWIDGTMNLMGMYGNTFEPDLLGLRHKALVGAAINFARAQMGWEPAGAPYADAMGQARYAVSSFVDQWSNGWLGQTVTPRAGGSSQEAALDTIIENIILDGNPGLTNEQLLNIMVDPESPEYQSAFRTASQAGLAQQLLNVMAPVSFRMRYDARDVRLAQMSTIQEAADAKGVPAYEFAPTQSDLAFRAKYKALTGNEWKPGDYESAKFKNDLARAPVQNKPFIVDQNTYNNLGTPKQQKALDRYYAIGFGTDPLTAGVADESARWELANRWADSHGRAARHVADLQGLRTTFSSTHPEYAEFQDWQHRVRALASQYGGSLAEYRRRVSAATPNAARYFAEQTAFIQAKYPVAEWAAQLDEATTNAAAFQAITGRGTQSRFDPGPPLISPGGGAANRYEQGPYPGAPTFDPTLPTMEPPPQPSTNWKTQAQMISGY